MMQRRLAKWALPTHYRMSSFVAAAQPHGRRSSPGVVWRACFMSASWKHFNRVQASPAGGWRPSGRRSGTGSGGKQDSRTSYDYRNGDSSVIG